MRIILFEFGDLTIVFQIGVNMRGIIKYTLGIYLIGTLLFVPNTATHTALPNITNTDIRIAKVSTYLSTKYKRDIKDIKEVVKVAYKYGHKHKFPTHTDILAIIAIESSFNKYAISSANARGYMQILYKKSSFDLEDNISDGVWLLKDYKAKLSVEGTIQAYNVGIGNYRSGMRNIDYLNKFKITKQQLERI